MKKNFLKIAAMLIAAMLLVVSCSQEVAPKNEDNGLVEAIIGLGRSERDVTVVAPNGATITYYYTLVPTWNNLNNGAPIYGAKRNETLLAQNKTISEDVEATSIGPVTPGLWEIEVKGYVEGDNGYKQLVLQGKAKAYFVNNKNTAVVFVAPVTNTEKSGKVSINLSMQDLGANNNVINYKIYKLGNDTAEVEGSINGSLDEATHVCSYTKTDISVSAGYKTITLSVSDSMGRGGITKSFLMIPTAAQDDIEVSITGSIYPSDFQNSNIQVNVFKVADGTIQVNNGSVTGTTVDGVDNVYLLSKGTDYTFKYISPSFSYPEGSLNTEGSYQWYLGSEKKGASSDTITTSQLGIKDTEGDFAVTCVVTYKYVLDGSTYRVEASQTLGKVRVVTPASAPTTTSTPESAS